VTVIGGGLAGMAASIHLSKAGLRVLCIEPDVTDANSVGESLDWSVPGLLHVLGLTIRGLLLRRLRKSSFPRTSRRLFQSSLRDFSIAHANPGLRPGLSSAVPFDKLRAGSSGLDIEMLALVPKQFSYGCWAVCSGFKLPPSKDGVRSQSAGGRRGLPVLLRFDDLIPQNANRWDEAVRL
jgi:hypothetical protein